MAEPEHLSDNDAERYIQACLSQDDVPEEDLEALEKLLEKDNEKAKEIALRLIDESMMRSWFRSEEDISFVDVVQQRLQLRFNDPSFVTAAMDKIHDNMDAIPGTPGETIKQEPETKLQAWYLIIPIGAALIYFLLAYHGQLRNLIFGNTMAPKITQITGSVVAEPDLSLKKDVNIDPGTDLTTGSDGSIALIYLDGTMLSVEPDSRFSISESKSGKRLRLKAGELGMNIASQKVDLILLTPLGRLSTKQANVRITVGGSIETIEVTSGSAVLQRLRHNEKAQLAKGQAAVLQKDTATIDVKTGK